MLVGDSIRKEVKNIFSCQQVLEYLNQTLIALIPKQSGLETVSQYKSISLCNTVYKIVTKNIGSKTKTVAALLDISNASCFPCW